MNVINWYKHRLILTIGFFIVGFVLPRAVLAEVELIWWGAPAEVSIRVGAVSSETTVVHDVPVTNTGDGTPITGAPQDVVIEVSARRATFWEAWGTNYVVTANSATPLRNGTQTIPFSDISWTSADGDIPAGRFDDSSSQVILPPTSAFVQVSDHLTFIYDNNRVVQAGTYTGSVTYTISIP